MTKLKSILADIIFLGALVFICWGVFKFSIASGLIASGIALIFLSYSIAPAEKKKS